jgi:hypothetical protein
VNTTRSLLMLLMVCALSLGCSTQKQPDLSRAPEYYFQQQRMGDLLRVSNLDRLILEGTNMEIAISTQLSPLSMIPREPSIQEILAREVPRSLVTGLGIVTMGQVMNTMSKQPRTVDPVIVDRPVPFLP